jgi:hypothetical protein
MWSWYIVPVVMVDVETDAGTISVPRISTDGAPWSGRHVAHVPTGSPASALVGFPTGEQAPGDWTPIPDDEWEATFTALMGYAPAIPESKCEG